MSTVLLPDAATLQRAPGAQAELARAATPAAWPRRILVATHGGRNSDQALVAAQSLAARTGAAVTVVTAYRPRVPVPSSVGLERSGLRRAEGPERPAAAQLLRAVHEQQRRLLGKEELWPVHFGVGDPVRVILAAVHETDADVLVIGIGRPVPDDRAQGDQLPVIVAHHLEIPLYAVAEGAAVPPRRVLLMLPDGVLDTDTVRTAWACAASGATIWILVPAERSPARAGEALGPEATRAAAVDALAGVDHGALAPSVELVEIAEEMLGGTLAAARRLDAQLIAVPVCGQAGVIRALLPNVAWPLLLTTKRSVLVAPRGGALDTGQEDPCARR